MSVLATPVNPAPSPVNAVATTTPPTSRVTVGLALAIPTLWLLPSIVNVF